VTVNFNTEINVAVHNEVNITNVTEFRPRHWDYIDYDQYRRPCFYNPIDVGLSYRYYYDGDYREVWVPAGGRIVLNVAIGGVFPFTAVGLGGYVYTGSFYGGAWVPPDGWYGPPPDYWQPYQPTVYNNMSVYVPAVQRTVVVNRVTVVGHDDSRPFGQQDSFMLDDNRLAWGQVADGKDGGRIEVTKSQATPGVGPVDDGGPIVKTTLAAAEKPMGTNYTPWILGGVILVGAGGIGWVIKHPKSTR
jgi:hypothetical protein